MSQDFWEYLQHLADTSQIIIDRPRGSTHHRFPNSTYPVNYGFLKGTPHMIQVEWIFGWALWME